LKSIKEGQGPIRTVEASGKKKKIKYIICALYIPSFTIMYLCTWSLNSYWTNDSQLMLPSKKWNYCMVITILNAETLVIQLVGVLWWDG